MFPEINGSRVLNWVMYYNRGAVFPRLTKLLSEDARIVPYADYVEHHLQPSLSHDA